MRKWRGGGFEAALGYRAVGALVAFVVGAVGACSSDSTGSGASSSSPEAGAGVCSPGDTRACIGPAACSGGQACGSNRQWLPCDCGSSMPILDSGKNPGKPDSGKNHGPADAGNHSPDSGTGKEDASQHSPSDGSSDAHENDSASTPDGSKSESGASSSLPDTVIGCAAVARGNEATFELLGWLVPGVPVDVAQPLTTQVGRSQAAGVSANGEVVVGTAQTELVPDGDVAPGRPFRWTQATGMREIGSFQGSDNAASATNCDGSVVVGFDGSGSSPYGNIPFVWTSAGLTLMGPFMSSSETVTPSEATAVTADGSEVFGTAEIDTGGTFPSFENQPFRWTSAGGVQLLDGAVGSAGAMSTDAAGDVAVGVMNAAGAVTAAIAFQWTPADGVQRLDSQAGTAAYAVSADGKVIAGTFQGTPGPTTPSAFRWTSDGGFEDLKCRFCQPTDVSSHGSVILVAGGDSRALPCPTCTHDGEVWDRKHGVRDVYTLLSSYGIDLSKWESLIPTGISDDARVIVGTVESATLGYIAFRATLPPDAFE